MASANSDRPQFETIDHADGTREFILSARRNYREKISFSFFWLVFGGIIIGFHFIFLQFNEVPLWLRYFTIDQAKGALWAILVPVELLLTYAVLNFWLRSSRILVRPGEVRVVTHWLFLKRTQMATLPKIIEIRSENNASDGGILYFDIVVVVTPENPHWLGMDKDPATGGKRMVIATDIKGKEEADRFLLEMSEILNRTS